MNDYLNSANFGNINNTANLNLADATRRLTEARQATQAAQNWCLRANTAQWESPAAAVFSRWLSELVLTSRRATDQVADILAAARNI